MQLRFTVLVVVMPVGVAVPATVAIQPTRANAIQRRSIFVAGDVQVVPMKMMEISLDNPFWIVIET